MQSFEEKILVMGLGYIGLPTASLLATKGYDVVGVDINRDVVDTINRGDIHIEEPDLDALVRSAVLSGKLKAALTPEPADIIIIAVPTPFKDDHKPDLSYIEAAARAVAPTLTAGNIVILESTSPVGATNMMAAWISEERPDLAMTGDGATENRLFIAHCPERVLPGKILRELVDNDRIIGGLDPVAAEKTREFYARFVAGEIKITDARTAELVKLVENSFRDVNIAFANELSLICDELSINVWNLIDLANCHPRVNILQPGPGVGGHCIAVDPWFIIDAAPETARLIRSAREVNSSKPEAVIKKVREEASAMENPIIACFGLAFKPDVDDLRESPAALICEKLSKELTVLAVEPHIDVLPLSLEGKASLVDAEEAIKKADICVMLVKHKVFARIGSEAFAHKTLIDTCGFFEE